MTKNEPDVSPNPDHEAADVLDSLIVSLPGLDDEDLNALERGRDALRKTEPTVLYRDMPTAWLTDEKRDVLMLEAKKMIRVLMTGDDRRARKIADEIDDLLGKRRR